MGEPHEAPPDSRIAEIAAMNESQLALATANAYADRFGEPGHNSEEGFAVGIEYILLTDVDDLEQRGHDYLALLVKECRMRIFETASRQTRPEQGPHNG